MNITLFNTRILLEGLDAENPKEVQIELLLFKTLKSGFDANILLSLDPFVRG